MKIFIKQLGFYLLFLIFLTFICSLLNLIGLHSSITNLILFIFNVAMFFIYGFKSGLKAKEKGYIAGLKIGFIMLIVLFIINIVLSQKIFNISLFIYYLILLLTSIFGGMLGISKKKED
ncbi:MAG: TIGR04086 family membrane protein [Firmicutes bacterium]|nr:TIGR04086 family membrane protein [Bacillota bacterium]